MKKCPYGVPGDKLYVRETWNAQNIDGFWWNNLNIPYAEKMAFNWNITFKAGSKYDDSTNAKWLPSIHMPKAFSRITLEIKDVRVERVQDITPIDAVRESCFAYIKFEDADNRRGLKVVKTRSPREQFERLWDSINLKRGYGWDTNCYAWVIEFEKI